jgi:hypothetical protein
MSRLMSRPVLRIVSCSMSFSPHQPRPHRAPAPVSTSRPSTPRPSTPLVLTYAARAIWSRFASPRAELIGSPSLSRPNLFAGD